MVAAAIVCAAAMSQAAMVNWDVAWVYSNDGAAINTYDDGSSVNYWVVNMLGATDTSGLSVDDGGNLVNSAGYAVVGASSFAESAGGFASGSIANGNYLAMIVYDAANGLYGVSDANIVSGIIEDPPTAGALATSFKNDGAYTDEGFMVANTPVAVPEPTSGLLLLLGVAGLALRRKRA